MTSLFFIVLFPIVFIAIVGANPNCGPNEILDKCPADCASDYCPKSENEVQSCPRPTECARPACKCTFNYRRAENGTCIPTRECPPFDCSVRPNEKFNPCPPLCPVDDCTQATPTGDCPTSGLFTMLFVLPCTPKCRCIDHYWRQNGICVPYDQCPKS